MTEVLTRLDAGNRRRIDALRAEGRFFWLDVSLTETSRSDLIDTLGLSERVLVATPRIRADGTSVHFACRCYVAVDSPADEIPYRLRPIEVRVVVTSDYLLTLHDEPVSLPAALGSDFPDERGRGYVVYSVLEDILISASDGLEEVERSLDDLSETMVRGGGGSMSRSRLQAPVARLGSMRRWVRAEQAVFERVGLDVCALPGFDTAEEPYFDRLDEQATRLLASIDAAGNAIGMVLDLQLNERAYLVSVVATIFVPLTFITGFFGMNFGWMIDQIDTPVAFFLLGFGIPILSAALTWRLFLRRFFIGDES